MKRIKTAALIAALALSATFAGCASGPTMTYLPSGDTGFAINCSGGDASTSWAACYKQAGEMCGDTATT